VPETTILTLSRSP
jgi:hypothetical protein